MPVCATRYQKKENPGSRINSGFRAKKQEWRRRDSNHYRKSPKPHKERISRVSQLSLFSKHITDSDNSKDNRLCNQKLGI